MSSVSANQLPPKLQSEFRTLVKLYEQKEYKKALKTAEGLLKHLPEHGETLSMRGLVLYHLDRKSEGYESAKRGLKAHLSSHVCWHVLGLLHRFDKNYVEAIKAYRTALRFDAENQVILKDLANLLVFQRDFSGYADVRRKILSTRPQHKANWFGVVLAETLVGNFEKAEILLNDLETSFAGGQAESNPTEAKFETSEILCLRVDLLEKMGRHEEALNLMNKRASEILDKVYLLESQAAIGNAIGNFVHAEKALRSLLARNPDNERYVLALFFVMSGNSEKSLRQIFQGEDLNDWKFESKRISAPTVSLEESEISQFIGDRKFVEILETIPTGDAKEQTQLLISSDFRSAISEFLRRKVIKGVPSLWRLLSGVWKYRMQEISDLLPLIISDLLSDSSLPPFSFPLLKLLESSFLRTIGNLSAARDAVDACIAHTPTFIDGILWRAKFAQSPLEAVELVERARLLDLADRSLNSKAVKTLLRANEISRASELVLLFSKESAEAKQPNLVEMQCAWWSLEMGDAHFRIGNIMQAVNNWKAVISHFDEFKEDEFDFAGFCLRKGTIRPFLEFLKTQDKMKTHKNFRSAKRRLVDFYAKVKNKEIELSEISVDQAESEMAKLLKN